jgi:hypothetical protein
MAVEIPYMAAAGLIVKILEKIKEAALLKWNKNFCQ